MVRLLAFALNASDSLQFTKGLSTDDEPELWQKSLSDEIELWIDLGQPDEKRIRKACGRAHKVMIYIYQHGSGKQWWEQNQNKLARFENLSIVSIADEAVCAIGKMAERTMRLQCTLQDAHLWFTDGNQSVEITPEIWKQGK